MTNNYFHPFQQGSIRGTKCESLWFSEGRSQWKTDCSFVSHTAPVLLKHIEFNFGWLTILPSHFDSWMCDANSSSVWLLVRLIQNYSVFRGRKQRLWTCFWGAAYWYHLSRRIFRWTSFNELQSSSSSFSYLQVTSYFQILHILFNACFRLCY